MCTHHVFHFARGKGDDHLLLGAPHNWHSSTFNNVARNRLATLGNRPIGVSKCTEQWKRAWRFSIDKAARTSPLEVMKEMLRHVEMLLTVVTHETSELPDGIRYVRTGACRQVHALSDDSAIQQGGYCVFLVLICWAHVQSESPFGAWSCSSRIHNVCTSGKCMFRVALSTTGIQPGTTHTALYEGTNKVH